MVKVFIYRSCIVGMITREDLHEDSYLNESSEEIISEYHTGRSEAEIRFDKHVSFDHLSDYLVGGHIVDTHVSTIHCLSVEDMPIGDCEVYTGDLYLKSRRYPMTEYSKAYRFYTQFDINMPRSTFDGSWEIQESADGGAIIDTPDEMNDVDVESLCKDLALMAVGGFTDNSILNIFVDGESHSLIEFCTHSFKHGYRQLSVIPSVLSTQILIKNPYGTITCIVYDIARWLWKHQDDDDVFIPRTVMKNIYYITQSYPIVSLNNVHDEKFDQWDIEEYDNEGYEIDIHEVFKSGLNPFDDSNW